MEKHVGHAACHDEDDDDARSDEGEEEGDEGETSQVARRRRGDAHVLVARQEVESDEGVVESHRGSRKEKRESRKEKIREGRDVAEGSAVIDRRYRKKRSLRGGTEPFLLQLVHETALVQSKQGAVDGKTERAFLLQADAIGLSLENRTDQSKARAGLLGEVVTENGGIVDDCLQLAGVKSGDGT